MSHIQSRWLAPMLVWAGLSCNVYAVDGVILIDQNRALVGGVTPGDLPGFPVTISQSGSYRLSGNLTVTDTNTDAISITADNVTIDLNGFSIIGPTVCTGTPVTSCSPTPTPPFGVGVRANFHRSITVLNGSVRGMGLGIFLNGSGGYVEKVHADSNSQLGISVFNGTVIGNTAIGNYVDGIEASISTASGNTSLFNGRWGLLAVCPSTVVGNTAFNNGNTNLFVDGQGCALANNSAP
jgi:hypothetical protein